MPTIAENLQRLVDAKSDIADAITAKGGTVNHGDGFEEFPADIATIPSGGEETALNHTTKPVCVLTLGWTSKSWSGLTGVSGKNIWTDGTDVYYSYGTAQYVLDKTTSAWKPKSWSGLTSFEGFNIWTDGGNIYYSSSYTYSEDVQYVLDKSTSTWTANTWTSTTGSFTPKISGQYVWTDGDNIYCTYPSGSSTSYTTYVLDKATLTWDFKNWSGSTRPHGYYVWTDGTDVYYSNGSYQYVLNKATSSWSTKTWSGLTSFNGYNIWTDGTNIFYSNDSYQYVLGASTWFATSWSGNNSFDGTGIWTDGKDIYCSDGSSSSRQYVLGRASLKTTKCKPQFS